MDKKELPERKPTRLKDFDYGSNGAYFITICTQNRMNVLSTIVDVGEGSPLPQLSDCGKIIDNWIQKLPDKYKDITVDRYVIMPNHIHLLLRVIKDGGRGDPSPTVVAAMGWLKYKATKEINCLFNSLGEKIFQRSFYDHIIRDYEEYRMIEKYIYENPTRWKYDKLYVE